MASKKKGQCQKEEEERKEKKVPTNAKNYTKGTRGVPHRWKVH